MRLIELLITENQVTLWRVENNDAWRAMEYDT